MRTPQTQDHGSQHRPVALRAHLGALLLATASLASGEGPGDGALLFARPGALYGHLGSGRFELLASRIEHLGAP